MTELLTQAPGISAQESINTPSNFFNIVRYLRALRWR
jgi:hypothetical protein